MRFRYLSAELSGPDRAEMICFLVTNGLGSAHRGPGGPLCQNLLCTASHGDAHRGGEDRPSLLSELRGRDTA